MQKHFSSQPNMEEIVCKECNEWPIVTVARIGHPACLEVLIKAADLAKHKQKSILEDALAYAAVGGNIANVKILIEAGADVNKKRSLDTPLARAVKGGHEECVEFLLSKGADVNIKGCWRDTAVDVAARYGREACLNLLIKAGANVNPATGRTPLMKAVCYGHPKCISLLIEAGADVNAKDQFGRSAISFAAERVLNCSNTRLRCDTGELVGDFDCPQHCSNNQLQILINAGADVNITDEDGNTPLIIVSGRSRNMKYHIKYNKCGRLKCVKLLLRSGAKVNLFNNNKQNALCSHICKSKDLNKPPDRTMVLLLYAAGETLDGITIDEDDENTSCVLNYLDKREINLKELCREAMRKHLLKLNLHQCLFNKIPQLGLPTLLTQYMLCDTSLDTNTK